MQSGWFSIEDDLGLTPVHVGSLSPSSLPALSHAVANHRADVNSLSALTGATPLHVACAPFRYTGSRAARQVATAFKHGGASAGGSTGGGAGRRSGAGGSSPSSGSGSAGDGGAAASADDPAGNLATVEFLLKRGADPRVKNSDGDTALHDACRGADPRVVRALKRKGAVVGAVNNRGMAAIHVAAGAGGSGVLEAILADAADLDAGDDAGMTPLHHACMVSFHGVLGGLFHLLKKRSSRNFFFLFFEKKIFPTSFLSLSLQYNIPPGSLSGKRQDSYQCRCESRRAELGRQDAV
jgi:hypothetical protein